MDSGGRRGAAAVDLVETGLVAHARAERPYIARPGDGRGGTRGRRR